MVHKAHSSNYENQEDIHNRSDPSEQSHKSSQIW